MSQLNGNNQSEINELLALVGNLLEYRWLIIFVTALFFLAGVTYALLATPIYQATALIQVEERKAGIAGLDVMDDLFTGKSQVATEIGILKSRTLLGKTVDNLGLTIAAKPQTFPVIGNFFVRRFSPSEAQPFAKPFLGLSQYDWGGSTISVSHLQVPRSLLGKPLFIVSVDENSFILKTEKRTLLEGKVGVLNSAKGVEITVDALQARPNTHFTVSKRNRSNTVKSFQSRLQASEQGKMSGLMTLSFQDSDPALAENVLNEVARIYIRQNIERASAEATNSLDFLRQQLPLVRQDMEQAEKHLNDYQIDAKSIDINSETQAILSQLVEIEAELSRLSLKQAEMDKLFTRSHPTYQTFITQQNILLENKRALEDRVSNLPELQQELLRLRRDVLVSSELYTLLLQKAQELDIARASTVGNVRLIDEAETDSKPVRPKKSLIVLVATLLGGMFSIALAYIHSLFNQGIRTAEEIEDLNLAVYASIPFSTQQLDTRSKGKEKLTSIPILSEKHPEDLAAEAFRSLRTGLHFTIPEAANKVLMISGPNPKVGKSFVAINLATITAQSGKKVLLIDGDMRKGHLHYYFGNKNGEGLSSVLSGQASLASALRSTHIEHLDFISRGATPPNPSELLLSPRFEELLGSLNEQYDLIIIDAPPVLAVTDALIIGKSAGSNMIVVRFDQNPVGEVKAAIKQFDVAGVPLKGAIFNAVRKTPGAYYKYGYYNYQYSYKSGES